jgi:hypothetical protein
MYLPADSKERLVKELQGNVHYLSERLDDDWGYTANGSFTGFRFRMITIDAATSEEIRKDASNKVHELREQIEAVYQLNYLASKAVPKNREDAFVICALPDYEGDEG